MADTYGGDSIDSIDATSRLGAELPDQWIQTKIYELPEGAFDPPIHVEYEFDGQNPIERDYSNIGPHPDIDVEDEWESTGVTVHQTHVDIDGPAETVPLASGKIVTVAYETMMSPEEPPPPPERQKKVLWLVITPA